MKEIPLQINNTIFTKLNVPLPVEDDEDILYYNPHTKFCLETGLGVPANYNKFLSYKGIIYITNYRLVYRPIPVSNRFSSFSVPIKHLSLDIENQVITFMIDNNLPATLYITFENSDSRIFFESLKDVIDDEEYELENVKDKKKNEIDPPYYSDVCE